MPDKPKPIAILATDAPMRTRPSVYPAPFAQLMTGRDKFPLGVLFGLKNIGVNITRLAPNGGMSALRHAHTHEEEVIYVVQGHPTLCTDEGRMRLAPGMCAGFKPGTGNAHNLVNETTEDAWYLEMSDQRREDIATYPDDDLQVTLVDGQWIFSHKDGTPY